MSDTSKIILVVEDNEDNRILAEKILNYYGFSTVIAATGNEALVYCDKHCPALILMDLSLPDIDGVEVARLLRQRANLRNIPIIALTAHAMHGVQNAALAVGMNDFLTKPFLPHDLIAIIRKYLI